MFFPNFEIQLQALEEKSVGEWYRYINERIHELTKSKDKISNEISESETVEKARRYRRIFIFGITISVILITYGFLKYFSRELYSSIPDAFIPLSLGALSLLASQYWYMTGMRDLKRDRTRQSETQSLSEIEVELERFVTLLATDSVLKEFDRRSINELGSQLNDLESLSHSS